MTDTYPAVLTYEGKHATENYLIESRDDLDRTARLMIGEFFDMGFYPEPEPTTVKSDKWGELTDEQVEALPESLQAEAVANRETYQKRLKRSQAADDEDRAEYEQIKAIAENPTVSTLHEIHSRITPGKVMTRSTAWSILSSRSDYEYEKVSLEPLQRYRPDEG